MKAILRFFFSALSLVFVSFPIFSQCIKGGTEVLPTCPAPVDFDFGATNNAHLQVLDVPSALDPGGRYKAFWILGDGNYRYFRHSLNPAVDALSRELPSYKYHQGGQYRVVSLLSEKKSNTTPPQNPVRRIGVDPPGAGGVDTFSRRLDRGKPVDVFNSEWSRPDHQSAFIVSAPKDNPVINGVYFFYNSKKNGAVYAPEDFHDVATVAGLSLPHYLLGTGVPVFGVCSTGLAGFSPWFFNRVNAEFKNYIFVPVNDVARSQAPAAFSEIRFFPMLTGGWNPAWVTPPTNPLPVGHYLAVTVGRTPLIEIANDDGGYITQDSFKTLAGGIEGYFQNPDGGGPVDPSQAYLIFANTLGSQYVHGVDARDVQMVLGIDPNGIQVLEICPKGQGRYEVKFQLEVCNKGHAPEENFPFSLTDHTNTFSTPVFTDTKIQSEPGSTANHWNFRWNETLPEIPLPDSGIPHPTSDENCATVEFSSTTNWNGVQSLIAGKAMELCVQFAFAAAPECHYNEEIVPASAVTQQDGYNCGTGSSQPAQGTCNICLLLYILLVLLILLLILQFWVLWVLHKKHKKNHT